MTTNAIPIMSEDEIARARVRAQDDEPGFGCLTTERGPLPLKAMEVRARITGLVAELEVQQTFVNTNGQPLEATYIFPLPDRAAVTRFQMEVNGRLIEGVLKERGEARKEYDAAIQTGHRAAITEEERPGVFTMRVGNLMPGETARVQLSLAGPLPVSDGEATFRFPLVVAPRYIPGAPLGGENVGDGVEPDTDAVPDASRITPPVLLPGYPNPVRLRLAVDLDAGGLTIGSLRSSLHAVIESTTNGARRVEVRPGERLDRDFILRFGVAESSVQTGLALRPDKDGEGGTFLLTLIPPASEIERARPRDVIFVLDRSGSMSGWKMVAARRAVARMVDTLTDKDRFTVYAFDDSILTPPAFKGTGLVAATDRNRFRAVEFLATVTDGGGTEMARPLELAATALAGGYDDRERVLVLVTDGQVGNEDQILRGLADKLRNIRTFTLGIDQAVNDAFLKRLALLGGGASELVESEDRLDEVMDKIHRRIATPILTELGLVTESLSLVSDSIAPARIPDLFAGAPLFLMGRYKGPSTGTITIKGRDVAIGSWSETVRGSVTDTGAVPTIWARAHLRDLEDRLVIGRGDRADLERRILETSLRFGVLCRFTAFVAVDRSEVANRTGRLHRVNQPVEPAAGWDMLGTGGPAQGSMPGAAPITAAGGPAGPMRARASAAMSPPRPAAKMAPAAPPPPSPAPLYESASYSMALDEDEALMSQEMEDLAAPAELDLGHDDEGASGFAPPAPAAGGRGAMKKKMAAPPPPAKPASKGGFFRREKAEREEAAKERTPSFDLSPYRQRAKDLLRSLALEPARVTDAVIPRALGRLTAELAMLLEDIASVMRTTTPEIVALERLLTELRDHLQAKRHERSLLERAVRALEDFANGGGSPSGAGPGAGGTGTSSGSSRRREGFWK